MKCLLTCLLVVSTLAVSSASPIQSSRTLFSSLELIRAHFHEAVASVVDLRQYLSDIGFQIQENYYDSPEKFASTKLYNPDITRRLSNDHSFEVMMRDVQLVHPVWASIDRQIKAMRMDSTVLTEEEKKAMQHAEQFLGLGKVRTPVRIFGGKKSPYYKNPY